MFEPSWPSGSEFALARYRPAALGACHSRFNSRGHTPDHLSRAIEKRERYRDSTYEQIFISSMEQRTERRRTIDGSELEEPVKLILAHKMDIADNTKAIWFEPEKPMRFTAGQFGDFTLTDPPFTDAKGNTRTFSFASAPEHDRIMIATRMRGSAFKRSLEQLPIGTPVQLIGPMGGFTLHEDPTRPAVFLTGGIGITPVRSIVEQATQHRKPHQILVFYSNRTRTQMAFYEDFRAWCRGNMNLSFIPTLTDERPKDWKFELGKIDRRMLSGYISDMHAPVYYIVGPPAMVAAMKGLLEEIDLDEMQIRSEEFAGY